MKVDKELMKDMKGTRAKVCPMPKGSFLRTCEKEECAWWIKNGKFMDWEETRKEGGICSIKMLAVTSLHGRGCKYE